MTASIALFNSTKPNQKSVAIFIGIPASGKTSFFRKHFSTDSIHVNLDSVRTRNKENELIKKCISEGSSAVIDNTNPTKADRARYIELFKTAGYHIDGYFFQSVVKDCIERNGKREGKAKVPDAAIAAISNKLELPSMVEGFDRLFFVKILDGNFITEKWKDET